MLVAPVTRWPGDPVNETARWPSFANILQRRTRRYPAALASEATAGSALASMRVSYVIRVSVSCAAASASSAELQTMNQSNRPDASFTWRTPSSEDRRSTFTTRVHVHTRLQKEKQDHKRVKRSGPKIICSFPKWKRTSLYMKYWYVMFFYTRTAHRSWWKRSPCATPKNQFKFQTLIDCWLFCHSWVFVYFFLLSSNTQIVKESSPLLSFTWQLL